jgi:NADH-quinone oxidoreductase subunit J
LSNPLIVFLLMSLLIVGCAIAVMVTRNIVHCIFYLLVALSALAGIYLLLDAQFLAGVQVLIYAGAVTVLLLFVIMLTMASEKSTTIEVQQSKTAMAISFFFWISINIMLLSAKWGNALNIKTPGITSDLAMSMFTKQILPFEASGFILLAALVGAIYLAKEYE